MKCRMFKPAHIIILLFLILSITLLSCEAITTSVITPTTPITTSPIGTTGVQTKASSALLMQIGLRKAQLATPDTKRLELMKSLGMDITNLSSQRIFIYLNEQLTQTQENELKGLGITIYPDSWIPPSGINSTGFILAAMPVEKLDELSARDYIIKLDTAEQRLQDQ